MKKGILFFLPVILLAAAMHPAVSPGASKPVNLGKDAAKMQWYLLDYGIDDSGVPYAVLRKYYTSQAVKDETAGLLISEYGLPPETAGKLHHTDYGYEFTPDGRQFAEAYMRHYDLLDNELYGIVCGKGEKIFCGIPADSIPEKAAACALGSVQESGRANTGERQPGSLSNKAR